MKEDNTPTVTSRRRTPSTKMRLRLQTAKRIKAINSKHKSARARRKEAKHNAQETDPEARVSTAIVPRIKKNRLADPPKATSKFKKRQIGKTWLPTHLWHTKRAHMTKPSEPLWRMAIPLSPTEKSYRPSHRASGGRGAVAWDMSYMATIGCDGVEPALIAMLKAVGFSGDDLWGSKGKRWRKGVRSVSGWAFERDNNKKAITPITVLWRSQENKSSIGSSNDLTVGTIEGEMKHAVSGIANSTSLSNKTKAAKRKILLRVHPSAFHQLWIELFKVASMQHPPVVLEDLRFEIASFEATGPGSTEALCAVLQPAIASDEPMPSSAQTWLKLSGLTNPASLPLGVILSFKTSDPRLTHPRESMTIKTDQVSNDELTDLIMDWPPDNGTVQDDIFSHKARRTASRTLPSQKAVNRRKGLTLPGETPEPQETDPQIPVILLACRPNPSASGAQGTWTVLLPWKCLDPIWRCLMSYSLSSKGTVRFGGLDEKRQIALERNEPWFPGDFPGTEAGKAWERTEAEKRYDVWKRKPPRRRVNYDALKLGNQDKGEHGTAWACDWDFLLGLDMDKYNSHSNVEETSRTTNLTSSEERPSTVESKDTVHGPSEKQTHSSATSAPSVSQLSPGKAKAVLHSSFNTLPASLTNKPQLATIRITLLTRGNPSPCARIYRLPFPSSSGTSFHRSKWLALDPHSDPFTKSKKIRTNWRGDTAAHSAYPDEYADIDAINYRPPNMVPEAIAEVEKKKAELVAKREKFQKQKLEMRARERGRGEADMDRMTAEDREKLMEELMRPSADKDQEELVPQCPGVGDLIGFVTSGGYNLRIGRGTAVGAVWVERVLDGWAKESAEEMRTRRSGADADDETRQAKSLQRERRLCVVRNAGETVGRLGLWEVCE